MKGKSPRRPPFHEEKWAGRAIKASDTCFEAELLATVESPLVDFLSGDIEAFGELSHLGLVPLFEWVKSGLQNSMFILRHPVAKSRVRELFDSISLFHFSDLEDRLDFCGTFDRFCFCTLKILNLIILFNLLHSGNRHSIAVCVSTVRTDVHGQFSRLCGKRTDGQGIDRAGRNEDLLVGSIMIIVTNLV